MHTHARYAPSSRNGRSSQRPKPRAARNPPPNRASTRVTSSGPGRMAGKAQREAARENPRGRGLMGGGAPGAATPRGAPGDGAIGATHRSLLNQPSRGRTAPYTRLAAPVDNRTTDQPRSAAGDSTSRA